MRALTKFINGNFQGTDFVSNWDIITEGSQYDTYCSIEYPNNVVDSIELATFITTLKDAVVLAVEAVSGPTITHSDITILGGPTV
jgi:hypothetical protein